MVPYQVYIHPDGRHIGDVQMIAYGSRYPVICLYETSRQLIGGTRRSLPAKPRHTKKTDNEYSRHGTVNLFVMFEPWTGWWHVEVTAHRTRCDFAECVRVLADESCLDAVKVVLVMHNLNTPIQLVLYTKPFHLRKPADLPNNWRFISLLNMVAGLAWLQLRSAY